MLIRKQDFLVKIRWLTTCGVGNLEMQRTTDKNLIVELSFAFALKIMGYAELLENGRRYVVAKQVLRSGTSVGANVQEAQHAESKADFIHKMKIASKEAQETAYWLSLCKEYPGYPDCKPLLADCISICKVLSKIISSAKAPQR